jgi:hypothetical protein
MDANIGGVYAWAYIVGFIVILALFYFINSWYETKQAMKKCSGNNILALFHTKGGQAYFKWCKDEQGSLTPADTKGYDKDAKSQAPNAIAKIKAVKQEFGWYAILPDHVFGVPYPLGSKNPKAVARLIEYVEDYPMPRVTSNMATWNAQEYSEVCSAMAEAAKDTGDIRAIISEAAGIEEKLMGLLDIPKMIESSKLWQYITVGACAAILLLVYMIFDKLGKLAALSGISAILQYFSLGV